MRRTRCSQPSVLAGWWKGTRQPPTHTRQLPLPPSLPPPPPLQERWIQGLLAAHALLLVLAVAYRRNGYVQGSLFLGISE